MGLAHRDKRLFNNHLHVSTNPRTGRKCRATTTSKTRPAMISPRLGRLTLSAVAALAATADCFGMGFFDCCSRIGNAVTESPRGLWSVFGRSGEVDRPDGLSVHGGRPTGSRHSAGARRAVGTRRAPDGHISPGVAETCKWLK